MAGSESRFEGFPSEAFDFYDALADNNTKPWWNDHKSDYTAFVRDPLLALLEELRAEFGEPHVFRPYRDARFSKDKTPIKDHQGGFVGVEDAMGYYVQVSGGGLMVAGGWYAPEGEQIARYRTSVDGPAGAELERILASMKRTWEIDGRPGEDPAPRVRRRPPAHRPAAQPCADGVPPLPGRALARDPEGVHDGAQRLALDAPAGGVARRLCRAGERPGPRRLSGDGV